MNASNAAFEALGEHPESSHRSTISRHQTADRWESSSESSSSTAPDEKAAWLLNQIYAIASSDERHDWDSVDPLLKEIGELFPLLQAFVTQLIDEDSESSYWTAFPLALEEYGILERSDFHDSLKYDYYFTARTLVSRMSASSSHCHVQHNLAYKIKQQLEEIASRDDNAKEFLRGLSVAQDRKMHYSTHTMRSPDFRFMHWDQKYPTVIGEIASSQTTKDLTRLADEYLFHMRGYLNVVFGINFGFRYDENSNIKTSATLWIWRHELRGGEHIVPHFEEITIFDESGDRIVDKQSGLRLSLTDFVCHRPSYKKIGWTNHLSDIVRSYPLEVEGLEPYEVFISLEDLQDVLEGAAELYQAEVDKSQAEDDEGHAAVDES
ncbi:uncharacterized protein Z520_06993 [Fonsecaea multimorphosa CBS 102226]|uniref:Uncharacterized protein n=1 Tax=Fonsecaea multimorphosa CBS 102226 TaxID=1442371 RepID=A0A0D2IKH9_9EURO|nr:uncharacterized protein Z520_06993 [Fonsecaea multimorphosa CBS 102226]KIX97541.1 hypothetical protein Z520_06993 [Fonsecaea multimorphosa CBS 102226]OAL23500.1 hypothetical protein AYO22_06550 [Fonsecaea multimorphosa]